MVLFDIVKELEKISDKIQDIMRGNEASPLFFLGIFIVGLLVFKLTYGALNKNQ